MKKRYLLATLAALSGCAATPNLEYRTPGPDRDGFMKFTLPQTSVMLAQQVSAITATVMPDDDYAGAQQHSMMADAQWSLWTSSTITKWEFVEGKNVVKSIATSAENNASKLLEAGTGLASIAAGATTGNFKNEIIDPFSDQEGRPRALPVGSTVDCNLRRNPEWSCSIAIGHYPSWVIPYAEFRQRALDGDARKVFPSSACVQATIRLTGPANTSLPPMPTAPGDAAAVTVTPSGTLIPGAASQARTASATTPATQPRQQLAFSIELADPSFVNLTRLRRGGELQANGPCRFNISNDKAGSNLDTQAFKDALALAKSLKDSGK
jgi:hypothetical protein